MAAEKLRDRHHALLLQGPVGPFFRRLGDELRQSGIQVTKINFNAGDALYYRGPDAVSFRGPMEEWPVFLRELLKKRFIDAVFLFGDCRTMHRQATRICGELNIPIWVFEEGYLRPNHITLERGGVNGNSTMPKDAGFYRRATADLPPESAVTPVGPVFASWAVHTALHATAATFFAWRYPLYQHHRNVNALYQAFCWVRGAVRKVAYGVTERGILEELSARHDGNYFFVPLQVHCDAQLQHSDYGSMEEFIEDVVAAFVEHAPVDSLLVIKHHPHDRPYRDYTAYLRTLGQRYRCSDRIIYVHDLHLPTLLRHARGTVTMNSTVGTSSLHHHTPVKVLGRAVYDIPGLTDQRSLAEFFSGEPGAVDVDLYEALCRYLRATNQINGSFYRVVPGISPESEVRKLAFSDQSSPRKEPSVKRNPLRSNAFWRRSQRLSANARRRRTAQR